MVAPRLIATCWTSAGDALPGAADERSPFEPLERVRAIAEAGWSGYGFAHHDLAYVRDTIGFQELKSVSDELGLGHIEIELASDWWLEDRSTWEATWQLLLEAATHLEATHIKVGTAFGSPVEDLDFLVAPMRDLAEQAEQAGTRVALEPLPFSMIGSMPQGAQLIESVNHPAAGLIVDYWHVFRAGTTLEQLSAAVPLEAIFGVELSDAAAVTVGTLFEDTRDRRTLIGEGEQDVVGFITTLTALGYTGPWGVEILSSEHRARPLGEALQLAHETALATFHDAGAVSSALA